MFGVLTSLVHVATLRARAFLFSLSRCSCCREPRSLGPSFRFGLFEYPLLLLMNTHPRHPGAAPLAPLVHTEGIFPFPFMRKLGTRSRRILLFTCCT